MLVKFSILPNFFKTQESNFPIFWDKGQGIVTKLLVLFFSYQQVKLVPFLYQFGEFTKFGLAIYVSNKMI